MSRSYKKHTYCGENDSSQKQIASSFIRSKLKNCDFEIQDGNAYKKLYHSWMIKEYSWYSTWNQYWNDCLSHYKRFGGKEPNKKEEYRNWIKFYRNK